MGSHRLMLSPQDISGLILHHRSAVNMSKGYRHGEPVLAQSLILISLWRSTLVDHLANVYKERITAL